MKTITIDFGYPIIMAMRPTPFLCIMAIIFQRWTEIMTRHPNVARVLHPMEEDGGFIGTSSYSLLSNFMKIKQVVVHESTFPLIFSICSCFEYNLNGEYHEDPEDNGYYHGIIWELWRGDYSLKSSRMMIRSKALHDMINMDPNNSMNNEVVRLDYLQLQKHFHSNCFRHQKYPFLLTIV